MQFNLNQSKIQFFRVSSDIQNQFVGFFQAFAYLPLDKLNFL